MTPEPKIQVLLVDDHQIFTQGLHLILANEPDIQISGEVWDGITALNFLEGHPVDVVITDLHMPVMNGVELCKRIKASFPRIHVIVLSGLKEGHLIHETLEVGASSYLLKDAGKSVLLNAIHHAMAGQRYLPPEVANLFLSSQNSPEVIARNKVKILTNRELEILKLVAQGKTSQEIAELLHISKRTVETHRKNMIKKLEVKKTSGLVRLAVEAGVVG